MFSAASVCLFACQHDNFRTIKRIDDETWRLGALYKNLARIRVSRSKVKGHGHREHKTKKWHFVRESSSGERSSASSIPVGKSAHAV